MSIRPSSWGSCKCNRKQVKGKYILVHQTKYLQSPSLRHPDILYAPDVFCAIIILSQNLIFLSPGTCMWLFYYTTKFHFLSSAEIKLRLEDTLYKGCSDKPDPRRWGIKFPPWMGTQGTWDTGLRVAASSDWEQNIGLLISMWSTPSKKKHPLGTQSKPKDSKFQFLACLDPFLFPTLIQGFKKHPGPSSGYNTLQQVAAFLQLQRVSVLAFIFPSGFRSTASLLLTEHHFSQEKGALFAISLPPPPPQLQWAPVSPQLPQPTPFPPSESSQSRQAARKGLWPPPLRVNECPLRREQGKARGMALSQAGRAQLRSTARQSCSQRSFCWCQRSSPAQARSAPQAFPPLQQEPGLALARLCCTAPRLCHQQKKTKVDRPSPRSPLPAHVPRATMAFFL